MISVHPSLADPCAPWQYAAGFVALNVDNIDFIARIISRSVWSGICWKDGTRKQSAFLFSDWAVLDFDDPGFTLAEACGLFCDRIHIIGTTKSHGKEKQGVSCDRFRVVLKWSERITELHTYRHNMGLMAARYPLDEKALDGARYFFPCKDIVQKSEEGFTEDIEPAPPSEDPKIIAEKKNFKREEYKLYGKLPAWIKRFISAGELVKQGGRNNTVYACALELFDLGHSFDEVFDMVMRAPIDWTGYPANEVITSIRSAEKRFRQLQGKPK